MNAERVYRVPARILRERCTAVMNSDLVALYMEADVRRLADSVLVPNNIIAIELMQRLSIYEVLTTIYRKGWNRCLDKAKEDPKSHDRRQLVELHRRCVARIEAQTNWILSFLSVICRMRKGEQHQHAGGEPAHIRLHVKRDQVRVHDRGAPLTQVLPRRRDPQTLPLLPRDHAA